MKNGLEYCQYSVSKLLCLIMTLAALVLVTVSALIIQNGLYWLCFELITYSFKFVDKYGYVRKVVFRKMFFSPFQLEEDELKNAVLLVFANKQDLPNALTVGDLTDRLRLNEKKNRVSIKKKIVGTAVECRQSKHV